uniref:Uncharacterized protein n=1 Tax=Arundo donax TaxID=35708 RepID=A0A0A9G3Y4_ARUDO
MFLYHFSYRKIGILMLNRIDLPFNRLVLLQQILAHSRETCRRPFKP